LPVQQVSYGPLIMSILIMSCYTGFFNVRRGWQSLNTGPNQSINQSINQIMLINCLSLIQSAIKGYFVICKKYICNRNVHLKMPTEECCYFPKQLYFTRSNKYQFHSLWFDPICARTHDLPHLRRAR
jgi:hypothetical protein